MARRRETQRRFCAARLSYSALFEEDNAGPELRKGQAGGCISALENLHLNSVALAGDGFCRRFHGLAGRFLLASHFRPPFPLRVRYRTACLLAENSAGLSAGGLPGWSRLARPGEDRARFSQPCDLFVKGIQYLIVQG
jgi:hypothetical protein